MFLLCLNSPDPLKVQSSKASTQLEFQDLNKLDSGKVAAAWNSCHTVTPRRPL